MYASSREKGFTLLELMITVAVVGILAAISIPSYMSHMVKVRRAAAAACLMEGAQYAERYYTTNMKYENVITGITNPTTGALVNGCMKEIKDHYTITGTDNATTYTLTATPINRQASADTKCGALTIDNTGGKKIANTNTAVKECW